MILIVEDDEDIRELIGYILDPDLCQLKMCATIGEFKTEIKTAIPDLILLDVMLPDGNGIDLCGDLKKAPSTKEIPVVLMSALGIPANSGANFFISKPFDIEILRSTVYSFI